MAPPQDWRNRPGQPRALGPDSTNQGTLRCSDPTAADQLLPPVYDELRKLAAQKLGKEKAGQALQATALVHEAYIRLVDAEKTERWDGRGQFFAAVAEAMRRILIEQARKNKRL